MTLPVYRDTVLLCYQAKVWSYGPVAFIVTIQTQLWRSIKPSEKCLPIIALPFLTTALSRVYTTNLTYTAYSSAPSAQYFHIYSWSVIHINIYYSNFCNGFLFMLLSPRGFLLSQICKQNKNNHSVPGKKNPEKAWCSLRQSQDI